MAANIVTLEDLTAFKQELLKELKTLLSNHQPSTNKWLKTHEVRKMLGLSPGSLQNLRVNGSLPFSKLGGIIYYAYDDIQKMLESHKRPNDRSPFSLEKRTTQKSVRL